MSSGKSKHLFRHLSRLYIHYNYGRHSNIPRCCCVFYILIWETSWLYKEFSKDKSFPNFMAKHLSWISKVEDELNPNTRKHANNRNRYQYIPCPMCLLKKRIVKIKNCEIEGCRCQWPKKLSF